MVLPDPHTYWLFMVSALVILLIPGPAVLYIMARSIDQGRAAGVVSALGCGGGNLFHVLAAAVGISAIVASSAVGFTIVKLAGSAYLIFLGIRTFVRRDGADAPRPKRMSLPRTFVQGFVVSALNPKIALFFVAFLPQFVDTARGGVTSQIVVLGTSLALLGIVTDSAYALVVGTIGGWLKSKRAFGTSRRYASGSVYIGLGVAGAFAGSDAN